MPSSRSKGTTRKSTTTVDKQLSGRTKKQIDSLPTHARRKGTNGLRRNNRP
jgi:hypothetical protein